MPNTEPTRSEQVSVLKMVKPFPFNSCYLLGVCSQIVRSCAAFGHKSPRHLRFVRATLNPMIPLLLVFHIEFSSVFILTVEAKLMKGDGV